MVAATVFSIGQPLWEMTVKEPAVLAALDQVAAELNKLKSDRRAYVLTNHLLDQIVLLNQIFDKTM